MAERLRVMRKWVLGSRYWAVEEEEVESAEDGVDDVASQRRDATCLTRVLDIKARRMAGASDMRSRLVREKREERAQATTEKVARHGKEKDGACSGRGPAASSSRTSRESHSFFALRAHFFSHLLIHICAFRTPDAHRARTAEMYCFDSVVSDIEEGKKTKFCEDKAVPWDCVFVRLRARNPKAL
jgi:hypothetical protein